MVQTIRLPAAAICRNYRDIRLLGGDAGITCYGTTGFLVFCHREVFGATGGLSAGRSSRESQGHATDQALPGALENQRREILSTSLTNTASIY